MNTGRNFSITERQSRFVDAQVESGRHASASEVVREALRRYEDDLAAERAAVAAIATWDFTAVTTTEEAHALFAAIGREAPLWATATTANGRPDPCHRCRSVEKPH